MKETMEDTYLEPSYRVDKRSFTKREHDRFVKLKGVGIGQESHGIRWVDRSR
ncbi:hypothetical protein ACPJHQ_12165 [Rossellomorea sp. H39__3]